MDGAPTRSGTNALAALNPQDLVRIEVLEDASASFYGMRGANGGVLVTTRRQ